jgi:hypothetical protein
MASLKNSLRAKHAKVVNYEENLETGQIWVFSEGNVRTKFYCCVCWVAPATGTAQIEIWGAGGSSARMCCCGAGIPGNAGAYSRKTVNVTAGSTVKGCLGFSCGNAGSMCFRGCSEPTMLCWCTTLANGCMCAEGGRGGTSICSTTPSMFCCFYASGFCGTLIPDNCGVICNMSNGGWIANAYGGDINCCGRFNCILFGGCYPHCVCQFSQTNYIPPGMISTNGSYVTFNHESDGTFENWTGSGLGSLYTAMAAASKSPAGGQPYSACWTGNRNCGHYEATGCIPYLPQGVGGPGTNPCTNIPSNGIRGGNGAIRIKFIAG